MNQIPSPEQLCRPRTNGRKGLEKVLLLLFFRVINAESKKGLQDYRGEAKIVREKEF